MIAIYQDWLEVAVATKECENYDSGIPGWIAVAMATGECRTYDSGIPWREYEYDFPGGFKIQRSVIFLNEKEVSKRDKRKKEKKITYRFSEINYWSMKQRKICFISRLSFWLNYLFIMLFVLCLLTKPWTYHSTCNTKIKASTWRLRHR